MTPLKFNFNGWHDTLTGYGKCNVHWMETLNELTDGGVSLGWERKQCFKEENIKYYTEKQKEVILKPFKKEKVGVIQSTPNFFKYCRSKFKIGYTMVENTHVGKAWVDDCNKMNHLFVPCNQLVDVYKNNGVKIPISVVPEGYDPKEHKYIKREKKDVFTFLTVGWLDERKNWKAMVQAFMSEFSPEEPVQFLMKNNCPYFGYDMPKDKRIKPIDHRLSVEDLDRLYKVADCFVFTTRGEGFGLPALEAMATGLPVILTDWLGLADLSDSRYNYPIKPVDIDHQYVRIQQQGFMANLDVAEIMYWMRHVYENRDAAMKKGKLASEWVKDNWTWKHAGYKMIKTLNEIKAFN